jgi:tRNA(Ile)-lysidine synthase
VSAVEDSEPLSDAETGVLFRDLLNQPALVLAVSGGPDSTALLVLAARWRARLRHGPKLVAVSVDHGLRPESGREARLVKRLAKSLGVLHRTVRWTGYKPQTGVQQAARAARYRLLAAVARKAGAAHILTAHTRDDQAETVLIRLVRGSGITGLGGMGRVTPLADDGLPLRAPSPTRAALARGPGGGGNKVARLLLVRPFLDIAKSRLVATLRAAAIPFANDPSNRDPRFTRARLRALMPQLAREGLDAARLALLAKRLRRADAAIEAAVDRAAQDLAIARSDHGSITLGAGAWARMPAEVRLRLLGHAIAETGDEGPVELGKLEALEAILTAALSDRASAPRFRRTLAGAMVTLVGDRLAIERAPPRRNRLELPPAGGRARKDGKPRIHQRTVK